MLPTPWAPHVTNVMIESVYIGVGTIPHIAREEIQIAMPMQADTTDIIICEIVNRKAGDARGHMSVL